MTITNTDCQEIYIQADVENWHRITVGTTVFGLVSFIQLHFGYHTIRGYGRSLPLTFLAQFDKHATAIGGEATYVQIGVDGVEEEEMVLFVLNAVYHMPKLYAANRLFFFYQTKEDSHLQRERFRCCIPTYIRQLVQELFILENGTVDADFPESVSTFPQVVWCQ